MATPTVVVLTTLSAGTYTINDLGAVAFTHPVTYTLTDIFQPEELANSDDLISLILSGNVTVTINGTPVPATNPDATNQIRDMAGDDQDASGTVYDNSGSGLAATNVEAALDELDSDIAALETDSHVPVSLAVDTTTTDSATLSGTDNQTIQLNAATPTTAGVMSSADKSKLDGIEANAKDDQNAAEVPYSNATSGLTATDVQAAIDEVEGRLDTVEGQAHDAVTLNAGAVTQQSANLAGQELELVEATPTTAGVMSAADKTKLDTVETNAAADQDADEVPYDNSSSGLLATDVQGAVDELDATLDAVVTDSHVPISLSADATTTESITLSGTDNQTVTANAATPTTAGVMSAADKAKLDGVEPLANNYSHPNHSGDVTSVSDGATTISLNAVDNTKASDMPPLTLKGNDTGSVADPQDLTVTEVQTLLNIEDGANNYVHPNHTGDVVSVGDGAQTIQPNVVDNTKLADMATNTFKGRSAGAGDPQDLSVAQVKTILDYQASEIDVTPTGNLTSNNVQDALVELQTELDAVETGYNRRNKVIGVIDDVSSDPDAVLPAPNTGDRYILSTDTTGGSAGGSPVHPNWDGAAKGDIVEWDGSVWVATTPNEGWVAYVDSSGTNLIANFENKDALFTDDATQQWEAREVAVSVHNDLSGLQGGTTNEYFHLTNAEHQALTSTGGVVDASTQHIHDDRYYTETELDAGQLDNRYYTETEISSNSNGEGASLVGVEDAAGDFTATTVEGVLAELQDNIEAVAAGAKMSWQYQVGRNANNLNLSQDLRGTNGVPTNVTPFIIPVDSELTMITAALGASTGSTTNNITIDVLRNGTIVGTVTIPPGATNKAATTGLTVAFSALDEVRIRYNYNGTPSDAADRPTATAYFREV